MSTQPSQNRDPAMHVAYMHIQAECVEFFGPRDKWTKRQRDEFHLDVGKAVGIVSALRAAGMIKE